MAYKRNSNLHRLAYALEKRADFLEDAKEWIEENPTLAAGLLGGVAGGGLGAVVPTEDGAGGRVRNALIGALLGGGLGAGAGKLYKINKDVDDNLKNILEQMWIQENPNRDEDFAAAEAQQEDADKKDRNQTFAIDPEILKTPAPYIDVNSINARDITGLPSQKEQLEDARKSISTPSVSPFVKGIVPDVSPLKDKKKERKDTHDWNSLENLRGQETLLLDAYYNGDITKDELDKQRIPLYNMISSILKANKGNSEIDRIWGESTKAREEFINGYTASDGRYIPGWNTSPRWGDASHPSPR